MALTDYERNQLEWMIDHGHSLDELMENLTYYQNELESTRDVNLTVSEIFDVWTSGRGFASLEKDGITKDMVREGIEHGVIRFEANPDPNDPWKTVCAIGNGWFYHVDTTDIPPDEYILMNSRNVDMVVDEIYDELNSTIKSDCHDDFNRYLAVLSEEHHGGVNSLTGIPFDINETMEEDGGALYNPETGDLIVSYLSDYENPTVEVFSYTPDELLVEIARQSVDFEKLTMDSITADGDYSHHVATYHSTDELAESGIFGKGNLMDVSGVISLLMRERIFVELCNRYGYYTYNEVCDSWLHESPLPFPAISQQPEKIAVAAGYCFNLVDAREASGIDLKDCGTVVTVDGQDYPLMKGATYKDSRLVDDLLDSYGEKRVSDYIKETTYGIEIEEEDIRF